MRDDAGKIIAILNPNVDDLLYAYLPGSKGQESMEVILATFGVDKEEVGDFRH